MPDVRPLNKKKYEISKHRFLEVYHHCLQYPEWVDELKYMADTVRPVQYGQEGKGSATGSATENLAIRRESLRKKCELIEQTAMEAAPEIYPYLLKGVTTEYATYQYLRSVCGMPCGRTMYYDRRRKFYWMLSRKF